ncbi:MAG TPA: protease modulator HflC [Candidatus Methylacidiphilales bacterium]
MNLQLVARILLIAGLSLYFLASMIAFQVRENEKVVITRFGQPVHVISDPGLYAKWPWPIESITRLDARLNFYEIRLSEALTRDRRNVIVPVFVAWKIDDPLKFVEAIGTSDNARNKIESLVSSAKNTILGTYDFKQLVSATSDSDVKIPEIEDKLTSVTAEEAKNSFGITIQQVGIERISLPEANTSYVFERMRAERSQFAERYLAEGRQQADAIRADIDAQKTVILADAQRDSEIKRGQAEADAADIYGKAHSQDPDLYLFLRKLETLKKSINQNTTLVLDANQAPFDLLKGAADSSDHESKTK